MIRPLAALLLVAQAGAALAQVPLATPAGAPVRCLPVRSIRQTVVRDDRTIDFFMAARGQVYRNVLPAACPELGFERAFSYETSLSVLCDVDIVTVFRQGGPLRRGASCGLGPFQPVTLAR